MVTDIRAVGDCTEIAITKWAGEKKKKLILHLLLLLPQGGALGKKTKPTLMFSSLLSFKLQYRLNPASLRKETDDRWGFPSQAFCLPRRHHLMTKCAAQALPLYWGTQWW